MLDILITVVILLLCATVFVVAKAIGNNTNGSKYAKRSNVNSSFSNMSSMSKEFYTIGAKMKKILIYTVLIVVIFSITSTFSASVLNNPFVRVPSGYIGVQIQFGKVLTENMLPAGFHIVPPWRHVINLDLRVQKYSTEITVRTKDQQKVALKLSVNYAINHEKVANVVEELIDVDFAAEAFEYNPQFNHTIVDDLGKSHNDIIKKVLVPMLYEVTNKNVASYGIAKIMEMRDKIRDEFVESLTNEIEEDRNLFLLISDVLIDDIDFSDKYDAAIKDKANVVQKIQQTEYELEAAEAQAERKRQEGIGIKNAALQQAKGNAAAKLSEGENKAKSILVQAEAQAEGYRKLAESYTSGILALEVLNNWDGVMPAVSIQSGQQPLLVLPQANSNRN
jgi:regulator of protease activity HflC (stomatin/prohibitin superfamily)